MSAMLAFVVLAMAVVAVVIILYHPKRAHLVVAGLLAAGIIFGLESWSVTRSYSTVKSIFLVGSCPVEIIALWFAVPVILYAIIDKVIEGTDKQDLMRTLYIEGISGLLILVFFDVGSLLFVLICLGIPGVVRTRSKGKIIMVGLVLAFVAVLVEWVRTGEVFSTSVPIMTFFIILTMGNFIPIGGGEPSDN
jgi:hypothetical protein